MSDLLEAAGVQLPITNGREGVRLATGTSQTRVPHFALALVVNRWAEGVLPDLLEKVERGEDATVIGFSAVRPQYPLEAGERAVWRQLTGDEVGDEPYFCCSRFTPVGMALPRAAFIEILRAFKRLREETALLPRPEFPPLPPPEPGAPLSARRLFTRTPIPDQAPSGYERIAMAELDDLAVALDAAEAVAATPDARADVRAKRRFLLEELEQAGLFDEVRAHEKRAWLEGWRMPTLRDYADAAMALRRYYAGPTRATYTLPPAPARLLDGGVALDWFRRPGPTPDGATPDSWLAFCEHVLHENAPGGASGELLSKVGARWYQIRWRRDDGEHAAVAAAAELVR